MDKALFLDVPSDFSFALGICFGVFAESSLYHTGEGLRENSSFSEEREASEKVIFFRLFAKQKNMTEGNLLKKFMQVFQVLLQGREMKNLSHQK